jgi:hypothetical protein
VCRVLWVLSHVVLFVAVLCWVQGLSDQWFNYASDLAHADTSVLLLIEPPLHKSLVLAISSFFKPTSAIAGVVASAASASASAPASAPPPLSIPVALPVHPAMVKQTSEGKTPPASGSTGPSPRPSMAVASTPASLALLQQRLGPSSDSKAPTSEGTEEESVVMMDEQKRASLEGLKKAVDQVCADSKMASDPYVINQLTGLLKKGMQDSGKVCVALCCAVLLLPLFVLSPAWLCVDDSALTGVMWCVQCRSLNLFCASI